MLLPRLTSLQPSVFCASHLKEMMHQGQFLKRNQHLHVTAFTDANWASNRDDCTSTSPYIVYLGGNAISWCSKKQKTVAHSSTKVEYRPLASCAAEVLWVKNLLQKLHVVCPSAPNIFCDNIGATDISVNRLSFVNETYCN